MTTQTKKGDFRKATDAKKLPRAVADPAAGLWEKVLGWLDAYMGSTEGRAR